MSFMDTITFRRRRPLSESQTNERDESINSSKITLDGTAQSLPTLSDDEDEQLKELREKNQRLTLELEMAHKEICNLNLENSELKTKNGTLQKENEILKKLSQTSNNKLLTPRKKKGTPSKQIPIEKTSLTEQQKYKKFIPSASTSSSNIETTEHSEKKQSIPCTGTQNSQKHATKNKHVNPTKTTPTEPKSRKRKICIISTNKTNDILSIGKQTFTEKSEILHYVTPGVSARQLLSGIERKLSGYTMNDFCILLIGECDFKTTRDYVDLVLYIRETLSKLKHTNIIICAPTYNCGQNTNMFNWRVETFNKLLYLDILSHEHAYFLDSNLNLSYDVDMFYGRSGKINDNGMSVVFKDLHTLLQSLICNNNDLCEQQNCLINNFDLDNTTEKQNSKCDFFRL